MSVNLSLLGGAGWQFFTDNGTPLAGGLLYTYLAGTSTAATTYTTSAGNVPNSNPIVLNSAGRVQTEIWLTQGVSYKFVLKTSAFITIGTYDNIAGAADPADIYAALAASSGSSLVGFIQSGSGAVATTVQAKLRETVSVLDFGAVGDGVTDDTAAFNAALAASNNVVIPPGTFKLTSNITVPSGSILTGAGNATILKPTAAVTACLIQSAASLLNSFYIDGTSTTSAVGVLCGDPAGGGASKPSISNLRIANFTGSGAVGLKLQKALRATITQCYIVSNTKGMHIASGASGYPTTIWVSDSTFTSSTEEGVLQECGYQVNFDNCIFESNKKEGFKINAIEETYQGALTRCWFEDNWNGDAARNTTRWSCTILGNGVTCGIYLDSVFFAGNGATESNGINLNNVKWTTLSKVTVPSPSNAYSIKVQNVASEVVVIDNGGRNAVGSIDNVDSCSIQFPVYGQVLGSGANNLNQFLQNTWTATMTASTSGTITLSDNTGYYVRQGRLVTVTGQFVVSGISSPVGNLLIGGLPVAAGSTSQFNSAVSVYAYGFGAGVTQPLVGRMSAGGSTIRIDKFVTGGVAALAGDVINGVTICIQCTYITD